MPLYTFKCKTCDHEFDINLTMSEYKDKVDKIPCPECESETRRVFVPTPHRWRHPDERKLGKDVNDLY